MQVRSRLHASIGVASGLFAALAFCLALPAIALASGDDNSSERKVTEDADSLKVESATAVAEDETKTSRKRKSKKSRRRRGVEASDTHFNQTVQRYLLEDCTVFGWLEVDPILQSEIGRRLKSMGADFKDECDEYFAPFDLTTDQIERIVYGGRSLDNGDVSDYVAIVFCNQPVSAESWQSEGETDLWRQTKVGQRAVWVKQNEKQWAVCAIEDRVLLAGADVSVISALQELPVAPNAVNPI